MSESKPRVWWASGWDINYQPEGSSTWTVFVTHENPGNKGAFKIILKDDYDVLEAKLKAAEAAAKGSADLVQMQREKLDREREINRMLTEALGSIVKDTKTVEPKMESNAFYLAEEALTKQKAIREGVKS